MRLQQAKLAQKQVSMNDLENKNSAKDGVHKTGSTPKGKETINVADVSFTNTNVASPSEGTHSLSPEPIINRVRGGRPGVGGTGSSSTGYSTKWTSSVHDDVFMKHKKISELQDLEIG